MTDIDRADVNDALGALRSDYERAPRAARVRIAARLAGAGLAAAAVGSAAAAAAARRGFLYSKGFAVLVTLPLGVAIGAAGQAWLTRPAPPAGPSVTAAVPTATTTTVAAPAPVAALEPVVDEPLPQREQLNPQPAPPKVRPPSTAVAGTLGLAHELWLLERARTSLSQGQPAATLEQIRQHRAQYPESSLEQEREALLVRALMATGRRAEARQRAAAFVQRYPSSVLRGSVERAVDSIP